MSVHCDSRNCNRTKCFNRKKHTLHHYCFFMMFLVVLTETKGHSSFYVFCKAVCKAIQPGKLRVRCRDCKQGTLTLSRVRIKFFSFIFCVMAILKKCSCSLRRPKWVYNGVAAENYKSLFPQQNKKE